MSLLDEYTRESLSFKKENVKPIELIKKKQRISNPALTKKIILISSISLAIIILIASASILANFLSDFKTSTEEKLTFLNHQSEESKQSLNNLASDTNLTLKELSEIKINQEKSKNEINKDI